MSFDTCTLKDLIRSVRFSVYFSHVSTSQKTLRMIWAGGVDIEYGISFGVHSKATDNFQNHLIFTGVTDISLNFK